MGKNQRIRKIEKKTRLNEEKLATEQRRKERLKPAVRLSRRIVVASIVTVGILYGGLTVDRHLKEIVENLRNDITQRAR